MSKYTSMRVKHQTKVMFDDIKDPLAVELKVNLRSDDAVLRGLLRFCAKQLGLDSEPEEQPPSSPIALPASVKRKGMVQARLNLAGNGQS